MSVIVIKIVAQGDPVGAATAKGELLGAGFNIVYEGNAEGIGVDARRHGDGEQKYGPAFVFIGKK